MTQYWVDLESISVEAETEEQAIEKAEKIMKEEFLPKIAGVCEQL